MAILPLREYFLYGKFSLMKLETWLATKGMRATEFARLAGLTDSTVSRLLSGKRRPEWATIDKIVAATKGEVTANDFVSEAA